MKITLERLEGNYHFEALNEKGNKIEIDSSAAIESKGMGPMQLLLAGIGGCSSIDIIDILKKQRQDLKDIKVSVEGEREPKQVPSLFSKIHLHYRLFGKIEPEKAARAVELSLYKYCSVAKILEKTAAITHSFEVIDV